MSEVLNSLPVAAFLVVCTVGWLFIRRMRRNRRDSYDTFIEQRKRRQEGRQQMYDRYTERSPNTH